MPEPRLRVDPEDRLPGSSTGGRGPTRLPRPSRRPQPRRRGFLRQVASLLVLLALWTIIIGGGTLTYFALSLPDTSQLTVAERRPSVTILAADGSLVASLGDLF